MEVRYQKTIIGDWAYAERYYKKVCDDMKNNPNTKIDRVAYSRPFRWERCKEPTAEFKIIIYFK